MKVKVRYIGLIADKMGKADDLLELEKIKSIKELLDFILKTHYVSSKAPISQHKESEKNPFYLTIGNTNELNVFCTKNGKFATLEESITNNDVITILPIIAGG